MNWLFICGLSFVSLLIAGVLGGEYPYADLKGESSAGTWEFEFNKPLEACEFDSEIQIYLSTDQRNRRHRRCKFSYWVKLLARRFWSRRRCMPSSSVYAQPHIEQDFNGFSFSWGVYSYHGATYLDICSRSPNGDALFYEFESPLRLPVPWKWIMTLYHFSNILFHQFMFTSVRIGPDFLTRVPTRWAGRRAETLLTESFDVLLQNTWARFMHCCFFSMPKKLYLFYFIQIIPLISF